jgi:hypothetical protein
VQKTVYGDVFVELTARRLCLGLSTVETKISRCFLTRIECSTVEDEQGNEVTTAFIGKLISAASAMNSADDYFKLGQSLSTIPRRHRL